MSNIVKLNMIRHDNHFPVSFKVIMCIILWLLIKCIGHARNDISCKFIEKPVLVHLTENSKMKLLLFSTNHVANSFAIIKLGDIENWGTIPKRSGNQRTIDYDILVLLNLVFLSTYYMIFSQILIMGLLMA